MRPIRGGLQLLHRAGRGIASRWRNLYYRALGVRMTGYCWLRQIEVPRNWSSITLEGPISLDLGVVLLVSGEEAPDKLIIRSGTYVNRYTMFDAHVHIEVGRNCMIGPHCYMTDANHGMVADQPISAQRMTIAPVILGNDVWLGAGVKVLAGVHIGSGTVVGAGSVVTTDLPENVIAVGVPARILGPRGRDEARVGMDARANLVMNIDGAVSNRPIGGGDINATNRSNTR